MEPPIPSPLGDRDHDEDELDRALVALGLRFSREASDAWRRNVERLFAPEAPPRSDERPM